MSIANIGNAKPPHNPLDGERPEQVFTLNQPTTDEQVSIIIVHRDRPEYLNILLQSIAVTSLNNNYEIIIVDNASTLKDAIDFLDELENQGEVKVIRNKENQYWTPAANQGARAADPRSNYFIFMHTDVVIINPAWIDLLINVSESSDAGLVGVEMHSYYLDKQKVDFVEDWCMLVSRECWNDCGPFVEELPIVGSAFIFTLACQMANHKPQVIQNTLVHHYRIFSVDFSEFERHSEQAMLIIPNVLRNLQNKIKKKEPA